MPWFLLEEQEWNTLGELRYRDLFVPRLCKVMPEPTVGVRSMEALTLLCCMLISTLVVLWCSEYSGRQSRVPGLKFLAVYARVGLKLSANNVQSSLAHNALVLFRLVRASLPPL
ncbi:hypothetical protein E2C01_027422 [Portunus trituberculatus]|uniref:Uncharacterized protein n=1 Tax=Portunus trituberculatus TaxID=210409 RepID=A0A5B7ELK9_PORTR|nr:hypothetical protein [Portunus trituberculatus]